jgi:hypothetical protein
MRCDEGPWPFRPRHITNDGSTSAADDPRKTLEGTGIITNRHLQGIQSQICQELRHPTTIVEFTLDGMAVRTDSPLLTYAIHPACREFRRFNIGPEGAAGHLCLDCDSCHARLIWGLSKAGLKAKLLHYQEARPEHLQHLYHQGPCSGFQQREIGGHLEKSVLGSG